MTNSNRKDCKFMNLIIGARDLVIAKQTADSSTALTYETVEKVEGLVSVSIKDNSGEQKPYHADDVEKGRLSSQAKMGITIELLAAAKATIAKFYGHTVNSTDGTVSKKDGDSPPYFAIGFKAATSTTAGGDDGVWFKKCIATKRSNEMEYKTKEGENVTIQTVKLEFEAIPTIKDSEYMILANSKDTGMSTKWATWFDTVPGVTS